MSVASRIDGKLRGQDCPRYGSWAYRAQSCARSVRRRVRMPRPTRRRLDAQGRAGPPDPPFSGRCGCGVAVWDQVSLNIKWLVVDVKSDVAGFQGEIRTSDIERGR